jgi:hypothetical protein
MNNLDDLMHKHFILNNADIFRPYFFKYCNLMYGREYPYNTDNFRKMLECIFNDIIISKENKYIMLSNIEDKDFIAKISYDCIEFYNDLIAYLDETLCQ